ncbi:MAG: AAA family ATPase, partial [Planctomycetaceae bacterium]|nr:AAA family ATPase [Planctomycetaceae bacterium]
MRRIVLASHKGGTAKSTTATCLAVGLARRGRRVLLVDCDAQANATWTVMGGQPAEPPTLATVLTRHAAAKEAIRPTATPNLDLLPADPSLSG